MTRFSIAGGLVAAAFAVIACGYADARVPARGLIGYWKGNGNAADSSLLDNGGSFSGSYVKGWKHGAKAFGLSTGSVAIPNITAYDFQTYAGWTVGFWFNTNNQCSSQCTFLGADDGPSCQNKWFVDYGYDKGATVNTFVLHMNDPSCLEAWLQSDQISLPAGWNQLTVVREKRNVVFYLNGVSIGTVRYTGMTPYPAAGPSFGYLESCCSFSGWMNDVVFYDRALTAAEVAKLANP